MFTPNQLKEGPLHNIIVVDLTRQLAGPQSTRVLADLGAKVIKVEQTNSTGDTVAANKPFFAWIINNKERISLDLRSDLGKQQLDELLKHSDVLVENFKPGVIGKMGYSWDVVHKKFPKLIMCSVSGFGQTGPWTSRPAMDVIIQAMSGLMSMTGYHDKPPVGAGPPIADVTAGLYGAIGILGALFGRQHTGIGSYVDIGMLDVMNSIVAPLTQRTMNNHPGFENGNQPQRMGSSSRSGAPFDVYRCKSNTYIGLIGIQPHFYESICDVINKPEMKADADKRFKTSGHRRKNYHIFKPMLEDALSGRTADEWMGLFSKAGVPCGKVNTLQEAIHEPQLNARNMLTEVTDDNSFKGIQLMASPINITGWEKRKAWIKDQDADGEKYRSKM